MALMIAWWQDDSAATAIEYGLIATMFGLLCLATASALSDGVTAMYTRIRDEVVTALS